MSAQLKAVIQGKIKQYPKKTIDYTSLEAMCPGSADYEEFARAVLELEAEGVLVRKKTVGTNGKKLALGMKYDVHKAMLHQDYHRALQEKRLTVDPRIDLESYYHLDEHVFLKERHYLDKIDASIKNHGMPQHLYVPELSFVLVGDEKWIDEKQGRQMLERIGLWRQMAPNERIDPIAFGINPKHLGDKTHHHLILENKTPFLHAMESIDGSCFSTVIYGQGWKVVSSIKLFLKQWNMPGENRFHYFGDIDYEGLSIFKALKAQIEVDPARNFYLKVLESAAVEGKANQMEDRDALDLFCSRFNEPEVEKIKEALQMKKYFPQEILNQGDILDLMDTNASNKHNEGT